MMSSERAGLFGDNGLEPKFDSHFRPLCEVLPDGELTALTVAIADHVEEIKQALRYNEFLDVTTAEKLASVLLQLLGEYFLFDDEEKRLVAGAARYFVHPLDADPDTGSVLGLDDDTAVLNYVLERIGRPELKVGV